MADSHIHIEPLEKTLEIKLGEQNIGESAQALVLSENKLPPVYYIPREDINKDYLVKSSHTSHCPHKGEAEYYHLKMGMIELENIAWSYKQPIKSVAQIANMLSFDAERIKFDVKFRT